MQGAQGAALAGLAGSQGIASALPGIGSALGNFFNQAPPNVQSTQTQGGFGLGFNF